MVDSYLASLSSDDGDVAIVQTDLENDQIGHFYYGLNPKGYN